MKRLILALTICLLVTSVVTAGPTGTVDWEYKGLTNKKTVHVNYGGDTTHLYAGELEFDITGSTGDGAKVSDPLYTFCIDLKDQIGVGDTATATLKSLTSSDLDVGSQGALSLTKANLLKELWGESRSTVVSNQTAAEFQLAVWEIVYEDENLIGDITGGTFNIDEAGWNTNALLEDVTDDGWDAFQSNLIALHDGQDVLATIPAPGAILLGSIGAGLVGWMRRRRSL